MAENSSACEQVEGSKPQLVETADVKPGQSLQLKPNVVPHNGTLFDFVESAPEQLVVDFFRQAIHHIEQTRRINDYHLKLKPSKRSGFIIEVFYGERREGPEKVEPDSCISCNDSAPLFPGAPGSVLAGECVLRELSDQPYVQCSLDAKARAGFIITPLRHVQKIGDLRDNELFALWNVGVRALKNEGLSFRSMIVNQGSYRNLPHLHLKIWVDDHEYGRAVLRWSEEKRRLWAALQRSSSSPKKRPMCTLLQREGKCRFGDRC
ncbi:hypothetical protein KI387_030260, partial [Taxus chinensis]